MIHRPRRLRRTQAVRDLCQENTLLPTDFILPVFLMEGTQKKEAISSLPGVFRYSLDTLLDFLTEVKAYGIPGIALFPKIEEDLKDPLATESTNTQGLLPRAIRAIKTQFPELLLFTDVAMDPYSSDGHDGIVKNGEILNDETLTVLCQMALVQADAGADFVCPSDMMDGRVSALRRALDERGHSRVGILAYTAKYASALYGPFRDALDSAPKSGDKKSYQMNPANRKEALIEAELDLSEGADMIMVKPAGFYLDIIADLKAHSHKPVAAYHVSGEYAMVCAAAEKGWLNKEQVMMEALYSIKRAGADIILSYFALEAAKLLKSS